MILCLTKDLKNHYLKALNKLIQMSWQKKKNHKYVKGKKLISTISKKLISTISNNSSETDGETINTQIRKWIALKKPVTSQGVEKVKKKSHQLLNGKKGTQYFIIFTYHHDRFKWTLALNADKEEVNRACTYFSWE